MFSQCRSCPSRAVGLQHPFFRHGVSGHLGWSSGYLLPRAHLLLEAGRDVVQHDPALLPVVLREARAVLVGGLLLALAHLLPPARGLISVALAHLLGVCRESDPRTYERTYRCLRTLAVSERGSSQCGTYASFQMKISKFLRGVENNLNQGSSSRVSEAVRIRQLLGNWH